MFCNPFAPFSDTPLPTSFGSTSNAFIFSLRNNEGLRPFKSMLTYPQFAICNYQSRGPTFGLGHDIHISDDANIFLGSYANFGVAYSVPSGVQDRETILAGTYWFTPDEVEVFYLR